MRFALSSAIKNELHKTLRGVDCLEKFSGLTDRRTTDRGDPVCQGIRCGQERLARRADFATATTFNNPRGRLSRCRCRVFLRLHAFLDSGTYRFPFIAELKRTKKIHGVKVTVTATLVIRSAYANA